MNKTISRLQSEYRNGILSGLTWGIDTTLIAVALMLSPFAKNSSLLLAGTFLCCLIHILFEAIFMSSVVAFRGGFSSLRKVIPTRGALVCIAGGICGGPIAMTCYLLAIEMTGADIASTVTSTYPLIGGILATTLLRERVSGHTWLGVLICVFGILYTSIGDNPQPGLNVLSGILMAIVTAIGWGFEGVACRYAVHDSNIAPKIALLLREYACLLCYLLIMPFFIGRTGNPIELTGILMQSLPSFLLVAFASIFGAWSMYLWYKTIGAIGATRGLCLNVSYCIWTLLFMSFVIGQVPSINVIIGAVMAVGGIVMALWSRKFSFSPVPEKQPEEE